MRLQQYLSRCAGRLSQCRIKWLKNIFIRSFCKHYAVDLADFEHDTADGYACFRDFFIRRLRPGARPAVPAEPVIVSPVDGQVAQCGLLEAGQMLQAKGIHYDVAALLASDDLARHFESAYYATLYLSPRDYHRVHMPFDGHLQAMTYVPGTLYPVNESAVVSVPDLFSKNERLICHFETRLGPMVLVFVGALIVGHISCVWHGSVNSEHGMAVQNWSYADAPKFFAAGAELGHFTLGSTVICLLPASCWQAMQCQAGDAIQMGQVLSSTVSIEGDD